MRNFTIDGLRPYLTKNGRDLKSFEKLLTGIEPSPEQAAELFRLFTEDETFNDEMWSMLHFVESLRLEDYVEVVIRSIKFLNIEAPFWSGVILVRILNSPRALQWLKAKISSSPRIDKVSLKNTLNEIVRYDESFVEVVSELQFDIS